MAMRTKHPTYTVKHIGDVYVDTGQVWIGDPCSLFQDEEQLPSVQQEIGTWQDFCEKHGKPSHEYEFDRLGVVIPSGWGDGIYPVYATFNEDERVTSVTVHFMEEEEDCDYRFEEEEQKKD